MPYARSDGTATKTEKARTAPNLPRSEWKISMKRYAHCPDDQSLRVQQVNPSIESHAKVLPISIATPPAVNIAP